MSNKPVKLTKSQIDHWRIVPGTRASGFSGGLFPFITAGQQWPGLKGQQPRFVLEANNLTILFLQQGNLYAQNTSGFVEDYRTYPFIRGAQGASSMATISVFVVDALMGITSVAGGPAAVAVLGKDLIYFVNRHGKKVITVGQVFVALAKARAVLIICAPTLYGKVVEAAFKNALGASWQVLNAAFPYLLKSGIAISPNIPRAVDQNFHKSGKATGKLIGKVGIASIRGKLSFVGAVIKVLLFIVMQVVKAIPRAAKIEAGHYKDLALQLQGALRLSGVFLTPAERDAVIAEIRNNPKKVADSIKALDKALQSL